jgi:transcriptional regulator with XRE-family HTH domain
MVTYASVRKAIGREIRKQRLSVGLSQRELAARLHMSVTYVGRVERGVTDLAAEEFVRIAVALNANPVTLLSKAVETRRRRG